MSLVGVVVVAIASKKKVSKRRRRSEMEEYFFPTNIGCLDLVMDRSKGVSMSLTRR